MEDMHEKHFQQFRDNIVGINQQIKTPYHQSITLFYADWTASGRSYLPIEQKILEQMLPFVANTHSETSYTGMMMTKAYRLARRFIKRHVNAREDDILIASGSGMTDVVNKLQRILGLRIHEKHKSLCSLEKQQRPVVFITHMEHHSNQTSWLETQADVVVVSPDENGLVSPNHFEQAVIQYQDRPLKIASVTACSNVSGIVTPFHEIAAVMHRHQAYCFVDFACSAPYTHIDMHPAKEGESLDAIFFSPHKFLGGPGSSGVLIFNKSLYENTIPDNPGGGTVLWTNPWGEHRYSNDIEEREDGGTPPFIQTIRAALSIRLKEEMNVEKMEERNDFLVDLFWKTIKTNARLHFLEEKHLKRHGVFSFYIEGLHYNLAVKMLNDHFGIQARGGCSCAGTYGHYLLNMDAEKSKEVTTLLEKGVCNVKPGWVRVSIHPTFSNSDVIFLAESINLLVEKCADWRQDYNPEDFRNNQEDMELQMNQMIENYMEICV